MKKITLLALFTLLLYITPFTSHASFSHTEASVINFDITADKESQSSISRAAITEWRYKVINGHLHKRLYNYSTGNWVGDWIPC